MAIIFKVDSDRLSNLRSNFVQQNIYLRTSLDEVTVSVLVEREVNGERVPEPLWISNVQEKTYLQINAEIRDAQKNTEVKLGSLSGMTWVKFIPNFLFRTFMRITDRKITMAKCYGKVAITAVGMFNKESIGSFLMVLPQSLLLLGGLINELNISVKTM